MERKELLYKQTLPYGIIAAGIFIRVFHYVYNRSLFGDEAYIAINFLYRGFSELLQPLEYGQRAPVGYLMSVELSSRLLGYSEMALRFVSVASGILTLFLFYSFCKRYFSILSCNIGLTILAFSAPLVYYSSELKQYMTEMLVTLLCYILYRYFATKTDYKAMFAWGVCGAILIWFSFPSVFVLGGIAIGLTIMQIRDREIFKVFNSSIAYLCWGLSFLINYILFIRSGTQDKFLQDFWEAHFMPISPPFVTSRWFARAIYQTLDSPLGLDYSIPAVVFFCLGAFILYKQKKELFFVLAVPMLLTLLASALHKYPFHKRFLVFLAPVFIIFISEGAAYGFYYLKRFWGKIAYAVVILLLLPPVLISLYQVGNPTKLSIGTRQEVRPVIEWMLANRQAGDQLMVNNLALAQFRYYGFLYNIDSKFIAHQPEHQLYISMPNTVSAISPDTTFFKTSFFSSDIESSIQHIKSRRLWVLFARDENHEEERSLAYLNTVGKQLTVYKREKAAVYLYQLNQIHK